MEPRSPDEESPSTVTGNEGGGKASHGESRFCQAAPEATGTMGLDERLCRQTENVTTGTQTKAIDKGIA